MKVGVAMVDVLTGWHAAVAILAAVNRGEGERIDVSLLDSGLAGLINVASNVLIAGGEPQRHGNAHPNIVPYQSFPTADGWIAIAAPNDGLYTRLCEALGAPELATDERFASNAVRVQNRETLVPMLEEQRLEGEFRRADERRVVERPGADGNRSRRVEERARGHSLDDRVGLQLEQRAQRVAQHDAVRIGEIDQAREPGAERFGDRS